MRHDETYLYLAKQAAVFTWMKRRPDPGPGCTALYRHFSAEGILLYVGISMSVPQRTSQHARSQPWFIDVVRIDIQWFDNRRDALRAERAAIKKERPLFNKTYHD